MPDIFISYAQADRDRVALIAEALEAEGYDVWWDRALEPGQTFRGEIANNLKSAKAVLVVWSKTSVHRNFVVEEAEEGLERGILVPVMIDNVVREIPHGFRSVQAANLVKWRGDRNDAEWKLVLSQVRRKIEQPSKPPRAYNPPKVFSGGHVFAGLVFFLSVALAGISLLYFSVPRNTSNNQPCDEIPGGSAWVYGGEFNSVENLFIQGPFFTIDGSDKSELSVSRGDWIVVTADRPTIILDFKTLGSERALHDPFSKNGVITPSEDHTCKTLYAGDRVYVADRVARGPNALEYHLWLRVREGPP